MTSFKKRVLNILVAAVTVFNMFPVAQFDAYAELSLPAPEHGKTLTPNYDANGDPDGTYTLSLSVTGSKQQESSVSVKKSNVIIIMDTSNSMNTRTEYTYNANTYSTSKSSYYIDSDTGHTGTSYRLYYDSENSTWRRSSDDSAYEGTVYTSRIDAEQEALDTMVTSLLANNKDKDGLRDIIEISLITYNIKSYYELGVKATNGANSSDYDTVMDAIYGVSQHSGTNWEEGIKKALDEADALKTAEPNDDIFIIFMTDGEPTARTGLDDYTTPPRNGGSSCRGQDHCEVNAYWNHWNAASDDFRSAVTKGYGLYDIFTYGDNDTYINYLRNLTSHAYSVRNFSDSNFGDTFANDSVTNSHFFNASNTTALTEALKRIANEINQNVSYTNVDFKDEVTSMTSTNISHSVDGKISGIKYYRSGGSYGDSTEWTDILDSQKATVTGGNIDWNLGKNYKLEDGVTYTLSFTVWPSQASMDLVADLNNGLVEYDDLTSAQKLQIAGSEGSYTLKTNADFPSLTYSTITETTINGETSTVTSDPITIDVENPSPVPLAGQKLSLQKLWEDSLDPDQREEVGGSVTLRLMKKNGNTEEVYLDDLVLEEENDWKIDNKISIAPGIMVSGGPAFDAEHHQTVQMNGKTYAILETGHEYYFEEQDINNHFELTNYIYHPMLVDGHLTNVRFTYDAQNNITGVESTTPISAISATNTIKGGINIEKKVVDKDGNPVHDAQDKFGVKVYLKNPDGTDFNYDYRIYTYANDAHTGNYVSRTGHICSTGAENDNCEKVTGHGGIIEEEITINDVIRVVNIPSGVTYYVEENNIPTGYSLKSTDYTIKYGNEAAEASPVANTVDGKDYRAVEGNSASTATLTNTYISGDLAISKTVGANGGNEAIALAKKFTFTLKLYSDSTKNTELTSSYKIDGKEQTIKSGGTFELGNRESIKILDLPVGAYYEVIETPVAGFTKVATGDTGTIIKDATQNAAFTNTYSVEPQNVNVVANKTLAGRNWKNGESFTFTLKDSTGAEIESKKVSSGNEQVTFTVPISNIGTYTYTIEETSTLPGGVSKSGDISVTIIATDNGDGTLGINTAYANDINTIVNTYTATGSATINVTKDLTGRNWIDSDIYSFSLIDKNGTSETTIKALNDATKDQKNVTFDTIEYTLDDLDGNTSKTFYYVIHETTALPEYMSNTGDIKVEVVVTDDGNGNLDTTVTYKDTNDTELKTPVVTNIYTATGEVELEVTKQLVGRAWLNGEKYEFALKDASGATISTGTATQNGVVTFDKITYSEADAGKTYTYTISETSTLPDGISKSGDVTATVTVNHFNTYNGKLDISVEYSNNDTIINSYTASGSVTLEAEKKLEGREWQKEESFTFTLSDAEGNTLDSQEVTKDGKVSFQTINYDLEDVGQTYTYTISETSELPGGMKKSDDIVVTVVVSDNGDGTIKTDVTYTQNDLITNSYSASGSVTLQATKVLEGRDWLDEEKFTFALKDASGNIIETKDFTANETIDFTTINYTKAGVYHYTIEEISKLPDGITASDPIDVTVTVVDKLDGTMDIEVVYGGDGAHTITNTYEASGEVLPQVTKVLDGRDWLSTDEFSFELKDSTGKVISTATATAENHIAKFDSIIYSEADAGETYTYTISEVTADLPAGVTNSNNDITLTVEIKDNANGSLDIKTTYSNNDQITNIYGASGEAEINVSKEMVGRDWQEGESYVFALTDGTGTVIKRLTVNGDGEYSFGKIAYTAAGTYTYTISEVSDLPNGLSNSGDITATVKVTDNLDGTLSSTVSYTNNDVIKNTYSESIDAEIRITKVLEGRDWLGTDEFKFVMTDENGNTTEASATTDAQTMSFGKLHFTEADIDKTYTYTISEVTDNLPGGVESKSEDIIVKVTVTYNHETGKLEVAYDYSTEEYQNTYSAKGGVTLEATKVLEGRDWLDGESYTFELFDDKGNSIDAKTVSENNLKAAFDEISYTGAGTYNYIIKETSQLPGGMSKSGDLNVKVTVTDNLDGTLTAAVEYLNGQTITNTYSADGSAQIEAEKILTGRDWREGESFTFELFDAEGNSLGSKTVTADGLTATFDKINYTEADAGKTFTYTIKETSEMPAGVTYSGDITVTVTVEDNHDGTLKATAEYTNDGKITNTYNTAATDATIHVDKVIDDLSNSQKDSTFTFELYDADGKLVESKDVTTSGLTGGADFSAIKFTEAGEYVYTVVEKDTGEAGFTYDTSEHQVIITVVDDPDTAQLSASVNVDGYDGNIVTITNPYEAEASDEVVFDVIKNLEGLAEGLEPAEFSFSLKDADGNLIEDINITGSGSNSFKGLTFDKAGIYTYTIAEYIGDAAGYTYDETIYTATVTVTDKDGKLVAEVEYSANGESAEAVEFNNSYSAKEAKIDITATKILEGRELKDDEFTFYLYLDGEWIGTATNKADGSISFGELTFTEAGTYYLNIFEDITETAEGIVFDSKVYTVAVVVTDNGDGQLVAEIQSDEDIVFTNKFDDPGKGENPRTYDDIYTMLFVFIICLFGLIGSAGYVVTKKNKADK